MKKKVCFYVIFILLINTTVVYASENETSSISSTDAYTQFLNKAGISGAFGYLLACSGSTIKDLFGYDAMSDFLYSTAADCGYLSYEDYIRDNYNNNNTPDDLTDDYINFSKEFVNCFNVEINNYVKENYGYEVYPACSQNDTWVLNHMKYFPGVTAHSAEISELMKNNDYVFFYYYNNNVVSFHYFNDGYIIKDNFSYGVLHNFDSDLNEVSINCLPVTGNVNYFQNFPGELHDCSEAIKTNVRVNYYRFNRDTKVFNSVSALNDYLYGEKMIYQMGNVNDRITDLTFNVAALNADWKDINEKSLQAILQAIKDKQIELDVDTLTEAELQAVIDATVSKRLDEIKNTIAAGDKMNQFQNQLIYEKLEQIYKLLSEWYKSGNNEVGDIVNNKLEIDFTSITDVLNDILEELKLIKESVDNVDVTNITNTTFNTDFDIEIVMQLQPAVDKMQGTFPFCIPWDIAACFKLLAHSPEPPHFIIPYVSPLGDYSIDIDFSDFKMLSDISRSLLTLLFILYLTKLTIRIWGMI